MRIFFFFFNDPTFGSDSQNWRFSLNFWKVTKYLHERDHILENEYLEKFSDFCTMAEFWKFHVDNVFTFSEVAVELKNGIKRSGYNGIVKFTFNFHSWSLTNIFQIILMLIPFHEKFHSNQNRANASFQVRRLFEGLKKPFAETPKCAGQLCWWEIFLHPCPGNISSGQTHSNLNRYTVIWPRGIFTFSRDMLSR